jgi:hypothetical protein
VSRSADLRIRVLRRPRTWTRTPPTWLAIAAFASVAGCGGGSIQENPSTGRASSTSPVSGRHASQGPRGSAPAIGTGWLFSDHIRGRPTCGTTLERTRWPTPPHRGGRQSSATIGGYSVRVSSVIEARIKTECHLTAAVVCPTNIPRTRGYDFTCIATTRTRARGEQRLARSTLTVFQTGADGNITLHAPKVRGP